MDYEPYFEDRIKELAEYLGISPDEIQLEDTIESKYTGYLTPEGTFTVMTEDEAREACSDYISEFIDDVGISGFTPYFQDRIYDEFLDDGWFEDACKEMQENYANDIQDEADIEGAQAALAEAGYPNGEGFPEITLSYYSNETVGKVVEALARQLQDALNISIKISNADWAVYYDDHVAGNYDIGAMGWSGDYVHPMTFLQIFTTGDANNNVFYSNAEYDALVAQAANMTDTQAAFEVMRQAEAIAAAEYPVLPLYYKANTMLMHDNVSGYFVTPSNALLLKTAYVEE